MSSCSRILFRPPSVCLSVCLSVSFRALSIPFSVSLCPRLSVFTSLSLCFLSEIYPATPHLFVSHCLSSILSILRSDSLPSPSLLCLSICLPARGSVSLSSLSAVSATTHPQLYLSLATPLSVSLALSVSPLPISLLSDTLAYDPGTSPGTA